MSVLGEDAPDKADRGPADNELRRGIVLYHLIEQIVVDEFGIQNVGLSDRLTDKIAPLIAADVEEARAQAWDQGAEARSHSQSLPFADRIRNPYRPSSAGDER